MLNKLGLLTLTVAIEPIQISDENFVVLAKNQPVVQLGRNGRAQLLQKRKAQAETENFSPKRRKMDKENSSSLPNSPISDERKLLSRELAKLMKEERLLKEEEEKLKRNTEKLEKKKLKEEEKLRKEMERKMKGEEKMRKDQEKLEKLKQREAEKQKKELEKLEKLDKQKKIDEKGIMEESPKKPKKQPESKEEKEKRELEKKGKKEKMELEKLEKKEKKENEMKMKKEKLEKDKEEKKKESSKSPKKPAKPIQKNTLFRYLQSSPSASPKFVKKEKDQSDLNTSINDNNDGEGNQSVEGNQTAVLQGDDKLNITNNEASAQSSETNNQSNDQMMIENSTNDTTESDASQQRVIDYNSSLFQWQSKVIYASVAKKGYQKNSDRLAFEKYFQKENPTTILEDEISNTWKNFLGKCKEKKKGWVKKGSPLPQFPHLSCIKLISHHDNLRPTFRGTYSKKSKIINGRKPLALDNNVIHYDIDSDEEWEEGSGEDISGSDDDEEDELEEEGGSSFIDGFVVPDGYLSDDEGIKDEVDPFEDSSTANTNATLTVNLNNNTQAIQIGVMYNQPTDDKPNHYSILLDYPVCLLTSENIAIIDDLSPVKIKPQKVSAPCKPIPVELIPEFIELLHGNSQQVDAILQTFLQKYPMISKRQLRLKMKEIAAKRIKGIWTVEGMEKPETLTANNNIDNNNNKDNSNNNNNNNNNNIQSNNKVNEIAKVEPVVMVADDKMEEEQPDGPKLKSIFV